jgi:Zn-dependent protease
MSEPDALDASASPPAVRQRTWLHVLLLVLTLGTTTLAGFMQFGGSLRTALAYSLPLMAILLAHEMGHFVAAKLHGVPASLPYFIPLPLPPGTFGAIISMRAGGIGTRRQLLDIGAAGPLAGLAVAVPVLLYGIHTSTVGPIPSSENLIEGNSILYLLAKYVLKGAWLPGHGIDIHMNATCTAGWFGLFVTGLNLLPIGQLDGGHVMAAMLGGERHERWSARLHGALPVVGFAVTLYVAVSAHRHGGGSASIWYGFYSGGPWFVWYALLHGLRRLSRGRHHPDVGLGPLDARRWTVAAIVVAVYVAIFMPWVWRIGPPP